MPERTPLASVSHMNAKIGLYLYNFDNNAIRNAKGALECVITSYKNGSQMLNHMATVIELILRMMIQGTLKYMWHTTC